MLVGGPMAAVLVVAPIHADIEAVGAGGIEVGWNLACEIRGAVLTHRLTKSELDTT